MRKSFRSLTALLLLAASTAIAPSAADAAEVQNEEVEVLAGETTFVDVLANDTFEPGAVLVVRESTLPGAAEVATVDGVLGINFTSSDTINPTAHYGPTAALQNVSYDVCEDEECASGAITVHQSYAAPLLTDDVYTMVAGDALELDVYANDQGFNGALTVPDIQDLVAGGEAVAEVTGTDYYQIRYEAFNDSVGPSTFSYQVCSPLDLCDTATVTVNVLPDPRSAVDDIVRVVPNESAFIYVHQNDPGLGAIYGPTQTLSVAQHAVNGSAEGFDDSEAGRFIYYTPDSEFVGQDSFVYESCAVESPEDIATISDCFQATVTIDVTTFGANTDYQFGTETGDPASIEVLGNDIGDVDEASFSIVIPPTKGTAEFVPGQEGARGFVRYTASQTGDDSFTYEICSPSGLECSQAEALVRDTQQGPVDPQPVIDVISAFGTGHDQFFDILGNDLGQINPSTLQLVDQPELGFARIAIEEGSESAGLIYATSFGPNDGTDTFSYSVCNTIEEDAVCETAVIVVEISGRENDVSALDDSIVGVVGSVLTADVASNDINGAALSVELMTAPSIGSATVNEQGAIEYTSVEVGESSFVYRVCDAALDAEFCDFGVVHVDIAALVVVANDDGFVAASGMTTELDVLANDEGFIATDFITIVEGQEPAFGVVNILTGEEGEATLVYTSDSGFTGQDAFSYQVCRSADESACDVALVTMTIKPACTIVGTSGNDILEGTAADDVICGYGGDDVIDAGAGDDVIYGHGGADTISGGAGDDTIYGGNGADEIRGFAGHDVIRAGRGNDEVRGGSDTDWIYGGRGNDVLLGGQGDDLVYGNAGNDTISGNAGDDYLFGGKDEDDIGGGAGNDTIRGGHANDLLKGGDGDDLIYGNAGDDAIRGNAGLDTLLGGKDDDEILGGSDDDLIKGGRGDDSANGNGGVDTCSAESKANCEINPQDAIGPRNLRNISDVFPNGFSSNDVGATGGTRFVSGAALFCGPGSDTDQALTVFCIRDAGLDDEPASLISIDVSAVAQPSTSVDEGCLRDATDALLCIDHASSSYVEIATPGIVGPITDVAIRNSDRLLPAESWTMCVIDGAGVAHCRGDNSLGTLGDGSTTSRTGFAPVPGLSGLVDIDMADLTVCANTTSQVFCWGDNAEGQTGIGSVSVAVTSPSVPVPLPTGNIDDLAVSGQTACSVVNEGISGFPSIGRLFCWGLYHGTEDETLSPPTRSLSPVWALQMPYQENQNELVATIEASSDHICALTISEGTWCWGSDVDSQVSGDQTPVDVHRTRPVEVDPESETLAGASNHILAGEGFTVILEDVGPIVIQGGTMG